MLYLDEKGLLIVFSGPSGVGKGTVRQAIFANENLNFKYSISATSRGPRPGERDGVDYFFKSKPEFEKMIEAGELLEHAEFVGNYYGTPLSYVKEAISAGEDIFLEITVDGAVQVREKFPEALFIFLAPPSFDELRNRIMIRGTETEEVINSRLMEAREEIDCVKHYDYVVVNDDVQIACDKVIAIIKAEHCRRERVEKNYRRILEEKENVIPTD